MLGEGGQVAVGVGAGPVDGGVGGESVDEGEEPADACRVRAPAQPAEVRPVVPLEVSFERFPPVTDQPGEPGDAFGATP